MSLLSVHDLTAAYGATPALFGVSFDLAEGETLALMGRNGMGKTTTIKTICGLLPTRSGTVRFGQARLTGLASHRIARRGIGLVPEGRRCFANLTVRENLIATARPGHWDEARVSALFPRLAERRAQMAATLSGGEQQMLAISRALMTNPRLLILDEATEGLAPLIRHEIWTAMAEVKRDTDLSLLIVDKSLAELGRIADRATILERGTTVWEGTFASLTSEIAARYLGI